MTNIVVVLTTVPHDFVVSGFAHALVSEGHAACVSVLPVMESTYRWEGHIESASERQLIIKTTADRLEGLEAAVTRLHPYEVPEFLVLPVTGGSDAYVTWVRDPR